MSYFESRSKKNNRSLERARWQIAEATTYLVEETPLTSEPAQILMDAYFKCLVKVSVNNPHLQVDYDTAHAKLQARVAVIPESPNAIWEMSIIVDQPFDGVELGIKTRTVPDDIDRLAWRAAAERAHAITYK